MSGFLLKFLTGSARVNMKRPCRKFPQTFGISKSSVSRKFILASVRQLRQLNERDLSDQEIIAIFMDGKSFAESHMIIALGVTLQGEKIVLGMVESHSENHRVCQAIIQK